MRNGGMSELSLFTGAGGGVLGTKLLGFQTVCAVENNRFCQEILLRRQMDGCLPWFPIWDDIRTFRGEEWCGVGLLTGGFPCQPFSSASRGRRTAEDLWPEMLRVVRSAGPKLVFAENVSRQAIDRAATDLETMGYTTACVEASAKDMGADHTRKRFWLLAHTHDESQLLRRLYAEVARGPLLQNRIWEAYPPRTRSG